MTNTEKGIAVLVAGGMLFWLWMYAFGLCMQGGLL